MAKRPISLPETKGMFKVRGHVTGMNRQNTMKTIDTKSGKKMNILNFGVESSDENTTYVTVQGMEQDKALFYKRSEVKGEKGTVKKVDWGDRFEDQGEGFQIIGVNLGLDQDENDKNIVENYTQFDGAVTLNKRLEDGDSVFVKGDIDFSHFSNNDGDVIRNKKFELNSLYKGKEIDFEAEDFKEIADFKQTVVFQGIEKDDSSEETRFVLNAKIVKYNSIEDADFILYNKKLAATLRKNLKPYHAITVWGDIFNKADEEEVEEDDGWGEKDKFDNANKTYVRELVITGADKETLDKESYSEESFEEAVEALNKIGEVKNKSKNKNKNEDDGDGDWGDGPEEINSDDLPW